MTQAQRFRLQARACDELGSPLYAALLRRAADDLDAGGVTAEVVSGYEAAPPGAAVSLRLLGSVHRLVLEGRASQLAPHYPSAGGRYVPGDAAADDQIWQGVRQVLLEWLDDVRDGLTRAPQTNETGRSLPLLGALALLSERTDGMPVRLVEIGCSAGLNLRADALVGIHRPEDLAALPTGRAYDVVLRLGCDLDPVEPTTEDGRLTLMSYVWPDDRGRMERLRRALDVAAETPAEVRRVGAADLLRGLDLEDGTVTVLWHSVMWQYLPAGERAEVTTERDRLVAAAGPERLFAHVSFEPPQVARGGPQDPLAFEVWLRWATGDGRLEEELVGLAPPHGVPVQWLRGS
jgi:hypothetical protein